jgi:hypothetical protein
MHLLPRAAKSLKPVQQELKQLITAKFLGLLWNLVSSDSNALLLPLHAQLLF